MAGPHPLIGNPQRDAPGSIRSVLRVRSQINHPASGNLDPAAGSGNKALKRPISGLRMHADWDGIPSFLLARPTAMGYQRSR